MECANSRPAAEYQQSRFLTDNSGGSDARNRGEHLVMPRRRQNLEHQVATAELYARVAGGFVAITPAVLPGSSARFFRGRAPQAPGVAAV